MALKEAKPITLSVTLKADMEYHLELDTVAEECRTEVPHWHLWRLHQELGSIAATRKWLKRPKGLDPKILEEVVAKTEKYSSQICWNYQFNALNGQ